MMMIPGQLSAFIFIFSNFKITSGRPISSPIIVKLFRKSLLKTMMTLLAYVKLSLTFVFSF